MDNLIKVKKLLWIILFANFGVALCKILIGTFIKSSSMTADGFHSLSDGASNIVCLIGINIASKPVDEEHPYGHRKFEILTGLFIAGILFFIASKIVIDTFGRFSNPVIPKITIDSIIVLILTLMINIFISYFEHKKGREWGSQILVSDSMHTRSDIYVSFGVLITLIGIKLGLPPVIDPIVSLIVSLFIYHAAYEIFRNNSSVLVDKVALDTEQLREIALSFEQVKDAHNIRSRGCPHDLHVDMHIMTEPDLSVEKSHELIHKIEEKIQEDIDENVQLIVHIEPFHKNEE